jgi:hypothetical protein
MAETQKFMGRGQLLQRLAAQMGGNEQAARDVLVKRGHMTPDGKFTKEGEARNQMTAEERAKDRASKETGTPVSRLKYDPKTNRATKRGK